jgi:hypothetical protein
LSSVAVLLFTGVSGAQMLGTSARQMAAKSWKGMLFYQGVHRQDLDFDVAGNGICNTKANGTGVAFACGQPGTARVHGTGTALIFKAVRQVHDGGLQFYGWAGAGDYDIYQGTTPVVQTHMVDRGGFLGGVGAKLVLWPETIVTPAIALDGNFGWQRYFGELRLDILQYQMAVEASRRFAVPDTRLTLEPYGGVKWLRTHAWLRDIGSGVRIGGMKDAVTPFLGLSLPFHDKESLFAEASFVNGIHYAGGLSIAFGN